MHYLNVFKNAATTEECQELLNVHLQDENPESYKKPKRTWTRMHNQSYDHNYHPKAQLYHDILERTLPKHVPTEFFIITTLSGPTMLHHDYTGDHLNMNVLLILDIIPKSARSFTMVFDQVETRNYYTLFSKTKFNQGRSPKTSDYSTFLNLRDESVEFDEELYQKYFKFLDKKDLEGLSIKAAIEWEVGDVIVFDNRYVHCSSDYETYGLTDKIYATSKVRIT